MRSKRYRAFVLLVGVVMLLAASSAALAQQRTPVRIFAGIGEHWVHLDVADELGYFADEGLDVEITIFASGTAGTEAFRAGRGDFVTAGNLGSIALWQSGAAIGIAPTSHDFDIWGIVSRADISSAADLRGRTVATVLGSTGEFALQRYFAAGGVDPSEVNIIHLDPPEMVLAILHGDIDAFAWVAPFTTSAINAREDIKLLATTHDLISNYIMLSVRPSLAQERPEVVVALLRALKRAIDFTNANPEEATRIWAEANNADYEQSLPVTKLINFDLTVTPEFIEENDALAEFMMTKGALQRPIQWGVDFKADFLAQADPNLVKVDLKTYK